MNAGRPSGGTSNTVKIGFPVKCHYRGGHKSLGEHGRNFWISEDAVGYGELRLTHGFPLNEISSVDVKEREFGGSDAQVFFAAGAEFGGLRRGGGPPASHPKMMTDITVRTKDGQEAIWVVEGRRADWVRKRLTPVLVQAHIPYYEDVPPEERTTYP